EAQSDVGMSRFVTYLAFFFFSSRRRHTRWPRDWSSDVCSSDLGGAGRRRPPDRTDAVAGVENDECQRQMWAYRQATTAGRSTGRSEERRVGKECRSRWAPED